MAYTTLVAGTTITSAWANASVRDQSVSPFASAAARSSAITSPVEGMVSHLNDVNSLGVYSGAAWSTVGPVSGALTSWTPSIVQSGSVTSTNTYSRYSRVGRMVTGWFQLTVTSTGVAGNAVTVNVPVASQATTFVGGGEIFDTSASIRYNGLLFMPTTATCDFRSMISVALDNRLGVATFTAALASGDGVSGFFSFEAAADA